MKIRYRWYAGEDDPPMHGCYLMSGSRPRGGYLITAVDDRGMRGGLGLPTFRLLVLTVERVTVMEAQRGPLHLFKWDSRGPSRQRRLAA